MTTIPQMTTVQSSNIDSIGHHDDELHVCFKVGSHYVYRGVSSELHLDLMASDSKGRFLNEHIKDRFESHKLSMAAS